MMPMTVEEAKTRAIEEWGEHAHAWKACTGSLCFVQQDARPQTVGDLTIAFGCGLSFEQAFENVRPKYAKKPRH